MLVYQRVNYHKITRKSHYSSASNPISSVKQLGLGHFSAGRQGTHVSLSPSRTNGFAAAQDQVLVQTLDLGPSARRCPVPKPVVGTKFHREGLLSSSQF